MLSLFPDEFDSSKNLLPFDGTVLYFGKVFSNEETEFYYSNLFNNIDWQNDEALIYGKLITTKRKVAWYGDDNYEYTYSNSTKKAIPWTPELLKLKALAEEKTGEEFNSCLLNLYHSKDS